VPTLITINTNGETINVNPNIQYYFIADEAINTFDIIIGGVNGVTFTNNYNVNDYYDCNLGITTTSLISTNASAVYVTNNVKLSTVNDEMFTFVYFTTGSLVLGFTPENQLINPPESLLNDNLIIGIDDSYLFSISDDNLAFIESNPEINDEYTELWSGWDYNPIPSLNSVDFDIVCATVTPNGEENFLWSNGSIYIHKDLIIHHILLRDGAHSIQSNKGSIFLKNQCNIGIFVSNFSLSGISVEVPCPSMQYLHVEGCPIETLNGVNNTNTPALRDVNLSNSKIKTLELDSVITLDAIDSCFDVKNSTLPNLRWFNISIVETPNVINSTEIDISQLSNLEAFGYHANYSNKEYITTDIVIDSVINSRLEEITLNRYNVNDPDVTPPTVPLTNINVTNGPFTSLINLTILGTLSGIDFTKLNDNFENIENLTILATGLDSLPSLDCFDTDHIFNGNLTLSQVSDGGFIRNNFSDSTVTDIINMLPDRSNLNNTLKCIYIPLDSSDGRWATLHQKGYNRGNFTWGKQYISDQLNVISESNVPTYTELNPIVSYKFKNDEYE